MNECVSPPFRAAVVEGTTLAAATMMFSIDVAAFRLLDGHIHDDH